jgi:hypothetical protein
MCAVQMNLTIRDTDRTNISKEKANYTWHTMFRFDGAQCFFPKDIQVTYESSEAITHIEFQEQGIFMQTF